jgi:hypothetical protein
MTCGEANSRIVAHSELGGIFRPEYSSYFGNSPGSLNNLLRDFTLALKGRAETAWPLALSMTRFP